MNNKILISLSSSLESDELSKKLDNCRNIKWLLIQKIKIHENGKNQTDINSIRLEFNEQKIEIKNENKNSKEIILNFISELYKIDHYKKLIEKNKDKARTKRSIKKIPNTNIEIGTNYSTIDLIIYLNKLIKPIENTEKVAFNKIIYGPPGTGKSYNIPKEIIKIEFPSEPEEHEKLFQELINKPENEKIKNIKQKIIRTTFHPEYSYGDFIGQFKPIVKNDKPSYAFVLGKLLESIELAEKNPEENVYLIIEEINRGNCAAIFGDAFQLLDRNDKGESEYPIKIHGYEKQEVKIPTNLYIFATMNTSDQNLYPMDSAFKRRWDMKYVNAKEEENTDGPEIQKIKNKLYEYLYNDALKNERNKIFKEKDKILKFSEVYSKSLIELSQMLQTYIGQIDKEINTWEEFIILINQAIFKCTGREDKEIGKYFIKGMESDFSIK